MKALKKLIAVLAVAALPMGALAADIKFKVTGDLNHRFMVFTDQANVYRGAETLNSGLNLTDDTLEEMWGDVKYRIGFEAATEDGMARGVYMLELGAIRYGDASRGGGYSGDGNNYETRFAYLDLGLPTQSKTRLQVGLQPFTVNRFVWSETAMGVVLKGSAGPANYTLAWMRPSEVFTTLTRQEVFADADAYLVRGDFSPTKDGKAGIFVLYQNKNPETGAGGGISYEVKRFGAGVTYDIFNIGVDAAYKMNDIFLNADLIYQYGKVVDVGAPALDLSAFVAHLDLGVNLGAAKVTYTGWYITGDDDPTDDKLSNYIATDVDFFDSVVLFEGGYTDDNYVTEAPYFGDSGALFNRLGVDFKASPKLTVGGAVMYIMTAADVTLADGSTSKAIGTEVDAYASYKINPNTEIAINAGYLVAGDILDLEETGADAGNGKGDVNIFRSTARIRYMF